MHKLPPEIFRVFFVRRKQSVMIAVPNTVKGYSLLGTKLVGPLTSEPRTCIECLMGAAFKQSGSSGNMLEVSASLGFGIVTNVQPKITIGTIGAIRMFSVSNAFPVFYTIRTVSVVFVVDSHWYGNLLNVSSHAKKHELRSHFHKMVEPKGIEPLSSQCE